MASLERDELSATADVFVKHGGNHEYRTACGAEGRSHAFGGRAGNPVTREFVGDVHRIHLDIAKTATGTTEDW